MLSLLGISASIYSGISFVRMVLEEPPLETREGPCAELIQEREEIVWLFNGKFVIPIPTKVRKPIWRSFKDFSIDDHNATETHLYGTLDVCDVLNEFDHSDLIRQIHQYPFLLKVQYPVTLVRLPAKPLYADYASRTIGTHRATIMLNAKLARRLPLTFTMLGVGCACLVMCEK